MMFGQPQNNSNIYNVIPPTVKGPTMKKIYISVLLCIVSFLSFSQQPVYYKDPSEKFLEAKEYFQKGQYSLAYPLLRELQQSITEKEKINNTVQVQEINYYAISTALIQNESTAEEEAKDYINLTRNNARVQMMNYQLAEFYFRKKQFQQAVVLYENANITNLDNREIADMKFHQGYAYFTLQQFAKAKPLLNSIRQIKDDPNYIDANYYYGFIAFRDKNYDEALQSFRVVENQPNYESIVPYYIAQIYYAQGKKDEALAYAENKLKQGNTQYYDLELKQLLGHAYFEKKQFGKSLSYLEDYV